MSIKVSITQAIRIMVHRLSKDPSLSILLLGPPGVAKTAITKQVADIMNREYWPIKCANKSPEGIGGYPVQNDDGMLAFSRPALIPNHPGTFLFIDEVGQCPTAVQNVIMGACDERKIGEHKLPEDTTVVMAANGGEHRAGSSTLHTAFMSRFDVVLDIEAEKAEWLDWAVANSMHPMLVAAVTKVFDKVVDFDAKAKGGFLTLRTLEQASKAMFDYDADPNHPDLKVCLYSCLGEQHASVLLGFMESVGSIPDYGDILADPSGTTVEIAMIEPIAKMIAGSIKYAHVPVVIRYVERYPTEQQAAIFTALPESVTGHPDVIDLGAALGLN